MSADQVDKVILSLAPRDFFFETLGAAVGHHESDARAAIWACPEAANRHGLEVAEILDRKRTKLYVFNNPLPA